MGRIAVRNTARETGCVLELSLRIVEETADELRAYASVPIAFEVRSRFRVEAGAYGEPAPSLVDEPVAPWIKDYDACVSEGPLSWAGQWDLSNWGILAAFDGDRRVGGAVLAWKTRGVDLLRGRDDLAVLWDLRVHPDYRGMGVGHALFQSAVNWAGARACRELLIETQNVNVPACRFYARQGCRLATVNTGAYFDFPEEIQFLWCLDLSGR